MKIYVVYAVYTGVLIMPFTWFTIFEKELI